MFIQRKTRQKSRVGFTVIEALVALVLTGIAGYTFFRSLQAVQGNHTGIMARQGTAAAMESALELMIRDTVLTHLRTLDTTFTDRDQGGKIMVRVIGATPPLAAVHDCSSPNECLDQLAQLSFKAWKTSAPKDTLSMVTYLWCPVRPGSH